LRFICADQRLVLFSSASPRLRGELVFQMARWPDLPMVRLLPRFDLHELPAKPSLDAEVAVCHGMVERRGDLHDLSILLVHGKVAASAAIRADGGRLLLALFVPCAGLAHLAFALEHERARGAYANAVPAIDAGRLRQRHLELRGNRRGEAASGHGDG